jgi:hypothetical protein
LQNEKPRLKVPWILWNERTKQSLESHHVKMYSTLDERGIRPGVDTETRLSPPVTGVHLKTDLPRILATSCPTETILFQCGGDALLWEVALHVYRLL